jgi:hypothetical protein
MLSQSSLLCLSLLAQGLSADYVPGRSFDRFITIWLENQVSGEIRGIKNGPLESSRI